MTRDWFVKASNTSSAECVCNVLAPSENHYQALDLAIIISMHDLTKTCITYQVRNIERLIQICVSG